MNPTLFFTLWSLAAGSLLAGISLTHHHYSAMMKKDITHFERDWKKWEEHYDNF